jgi:hypothetical protein
VLISGGFDPSGWIFLPDASAELPPQVVQAYGEVSPDGVEHLPVVAAKLAQAAAEDPGLPESELGRIGSRTLVMTADDDLVHLEHTIAVPRHPGLRAGGGPGHLPHAPGGEARAVRAAGHRLPHHRSRHHVHPDPPIGGRPGMITGR